MPKASAKSVRRRQESMDTDSDDDVPSTQSRGASSRTTEDLERKANELVQYLINADRKKHAIKRLDINKHVLKEDSKQFPLIIAKAEEKLAHVYGIKLVKLDTQPPKYILVNNLSTPYDPSDKNCVGDLSDLESAKMGLLTVILSCIFMRGNIIPDHELYYMLKKLDVDVDRTHEVFGDVKKLLTQEFVRQLYLEYERQHKSDPPSYSFLWGQRAKAEASKFNCLKFVSKIYRNVKYDAWVSQYEDVIRTEGVLREIETEEQDMVDENDAPSSSRRRERP